MLNLYSIFHLNLAYSSIEEEQRSEVIKKCYWPLLNLIEELDLPVGIESPGYTLETIQRIDPTWIEKLQMLLGYNKCEFVGSGYMQIIGPLVPAEVNRRNQQIGLEVYKQLLGVRPGVALVNEQAYSAGLVQHYLDAGYDAIVMEWNNPAKYHPEWEKDWMFLPQQASGTSDETISLIWSNSIIFQKFQRYIHGEIEMEEYIDYLARHIGDRPRAFPLYANDIEIFDYRPGRYHTEASFHPEGEWARMRRLFEALKIDNRFEIVSPSHILGLLDLPGAGNILHLESSEAPIPVKKQKKYNITRWAVTGRDDSGINTGCWKIYSGLKKAERLKTIWAPEIDACWKELCYLWGSDFRTHVSEKRWKDYLGRLDKMTPRVEELTGQKREVTGGVRELLSTSTHKSSVKKDTYRTEQEGHFFSVETNQLMIRLNCRRGGAIDALYFKGLSEKPLICTLPHGYYDDIALGADYYSGHSIVEIPGNRKITDLNPATPVIKDGVIGDHPCLLIKVAVPSELGEVSKTYYIYPDRQRVDLHYQFDWPEVPLGTFRTGIITLNPEAFNRETLYYGTYNGGFEAETFLLKGRTVSHDEPASALVSSQQVLGATEGWVEIGDSRKSIIVHADRNVSAVMPMINYCETDDTFFCRLLWSVKEIDETCKSGALAANIKPNVHLIIEGKNRQ